MSLLFLGLVVLLLTVSTTNSTPPLPSLPFGLFVPLYDDPTLGFDDWERLQTIVSQYNDRSFIVVVNPSSGPGWNVSQDYIRLMSSFPNNVTFLGYVNVLSQQQVFRSEDELRGDVQRWYKFYGDYIGGLFFDNIENIAQVKIVDQNKVSTIHSLSLYAQEKANDPSRARIAINPRGPTMEEYYSFVDYAVLFEGPLSSWISSDPNRDCIGPFCSFSDVGAQILSIQQKVEEGAYNTQFVAILYDVANVLNEDVLQNGNGISWYYITDRNCDKQNTTTTTTLTTDWCWSHLANLQLLDDLLSIPIETPQSTQMATTNTTTPTVPLATDQLMEIRERSFETALVVVGVITGTALLLGAVALFMICRFLRKDGEEEVYTMQQW